MITSLKGDRTMVEPGGTYVVEGRYKLVTHAEAVLAVERSRFAADEGLVASLGS